MNYSDNLIFEVRNLYKQAKDVYINCKKPVNYITGWINRRLQNKLSTEDIYCIINNIKEKPRCPICGNNCKFYNLSKGYAKTCGNGKCVGESNALKTKGKTYKEIYGDRIVRCGFQKGQDNIAKRQDIRKKISIGVRNSYKDRNLINRRSINLLNNPILRLNKIISDNYGNFYRSKLEAAFSNFLIENNIPFKYEERFKMCNGHTKIVDFLLYDNVWVEISGYAYAGWQQDFNNKIKMFQESIDVYENIIYILTYKNKLDLLVKNLIFNNSILPQKKLTNLNVFYNRIEIDGNQIINKKEIMRDIKFIESITLGNKYLKEHNLI